MDKALSDEDHLKIVEVLTKYESDTVKFHALQTREAGRQRFVSMHVLVPGAWTIQKGHDLSEELEADIIRDLQTRSLQPMLNRLKMSALGQMNPKASIAGSN